MKLKDTRSFGALIGRKFNYHHKTWLIEDVIFRFTDGEVILKCDKRRIEYDKVSNQDLVEEEPFNTEEYKKWECEVELKKALRKFVGMPNTPAIRTEIREITETILNKYLVEEAREDLAAENATLLQAIGLATTALPSMVMRRQDPIGMMQEVVAEVSALRKVVEDIKAERDAEAQSSLDYLEECVALRKVAGAARKEQEKHEVFRATEMLPCECPCNLCIAVRECDGKGK